MEIKKNITSIFMVPTLKIPKEKIKINGFINGYISDNRKDVQYEESIYLLFKPEDIDKFRDFLDEEYERTRSIIDDYDYENGFVVVVYKLNPKFKKDFELVKLGKYSKTSIEFQEQFPKSMRIEKGNLHKDEISLQYRIFNKTIDLINYWEEKLGVTLSKDMEVWEGFNLEEETLNIERIKQYA